MHNRVFWRADFSGWASIEYCGQSYFAEIDNVSLQGFFFKKYLEVPLNMTLAVKIYNSNLGTTFCVNASVVRKKASGIGFQIEEIDQEDSVYLSNIVACDDLIDVELN